MTEERHSNWKQDNISGYNAKLLNVFEKLNQLARMSMNAKLAELKDNVRREAKKHNHPLLDQISQEVEKLEIS